MDTNVYSNWTLQQYLECPYLNRSTVFEYEQCPLKVGHHSASNHDLDFGSLYHAWILDKYNLSNNFELVAKRPRNIKETIRLHEQLGKIPITEPWLQAVIDMEGVLAQHPLTSDFIKTFTAPETTIVFDFLGHQCKARIDALWPERNAIVDLKSASRADVFSMRNASERYGYGFQAIFHMEGYYSAVQAQALPEGYENYILICQEKEPPYAIGVYQYSEQKLESLRKRVCNAIHTMEQSSGRPPAHYNNDEIEFL